MKSVWLFLGLLVVIGCQKTIQNPEAYLENLLAHPQIFQEGVVEYRLNYLPMDYFMARELKNHSQPDNQINRDSLKSVVVNQYGGGTYYLLRLVLDSANRENPQAKASLSEKMMRFQSQQEEIRMEISGHLKNGNTIHPDILIVDSDWITKSGATILFSFRKQDASGLKRMEFGKSFVVAENWMVEASKLEPRIRLKG